LQIFNFVVHEYKGVTKTTTTTTMMVMIIINQLGKKKTQREDRILYFFSRLRFTLVDTNLSVSCQH